ncbi:hypothetical protein [Edaphocola flava]|uniref:hypothetical protein n=1 Tax=Edaphocola flava TaxID=2499629 RepID=UPI00100AFC5B|nr:hypothetical protein [Edaphocola flava]
MRYLILLAGLCLGLMACHTDDQSAETVAAPKTINYHSKEIGWTITVPKDWLLTSSLRGIILVSS